MDSIGKKTKVLYIATHFINPTAKELRYLFELLWCIKTRWETALCIRMKFLPLLLLFAPQHIHTAIFDRSQQTHSFLQIMQITSTRICCCCCFCDEMIGRGSMAIMAYVRWWRWWRSILRMTELPQPNLGYAAANICTSKKLPRLTTTTTTATLIHLRFQRRHCISVLHPVALYTLFAFYRGSTDIFQATDNNNNNNNVMQQDGLLPTTNFYYY